jgi:hypothetical protein
MSPHSKGFGEGSGRQAEGSGKQSAKAITRGLDQRGRISQVWRVSLEVFEIRGRFRPCSRQRRPSLRGC